MTSPKTIARTVTNTNSLSLDGLARQRWRGVASPLRQSCTRGLAQLIYIKAPRAGPSDSLAAEIVGGADRDLCRAARNAVDPEQQTRLPGEAPPQTKAAQNATTVPGHSSR